jgi:subtilisin family serine protease
MRSSFRLKTLAAIVVASLGGAAASPILANDVALAKAGVISPSEVRQTYMVEFQEDGALHYKGGVGNLRATALDASGRTEFSAASEDVKAYVAYLEVEVANRTAAIGALLGRDATATHKFFYTHTGIALELTEDEAAKVATMPGVKSIGISGEERLDTFRGPDFIGAPTIWNAPTPGGVTNRGFGVRIAILDSGANSTHPSFANDASCGFTAGNPKLVAKSCATATGPGGTCNGPNPEADAVSSSHGVHTASTAGGNTLTASASPAPTIPAPYTQISGVAPCAGVDSYKVCNTASGTCAVVDSVAAVNNAIATIDTGVKALNFSIGGGNSPWAAANDSDRAFLNAVNAGIFVAASAGNTRTEIPDPVGQVNHRGPWTMTVANSYHDLNPAATLSILEPSAPSTLQNIVMNKGSTTPEGVLLANQPVRTYPANIEGCTASGGFPAGTFTGAIAVVRRGTCAFTEKITNAVNAGAAAVIVANNQAGSISMDTTGAPASTPAYSISSQAVGDEVIAFINANATTSVGTFDPTGRLPDKLADSSLRGPIAGTLADLTKPDISGPGTSIYAGARTEDGSYVYMSGTSMSSPHVAGAGALLRAVRPTWSVMEVKSALQMTAKRTGWKDTGTAPWDADDVGSGRVDLTKAASAGLVMHETYDNFLAANPSGGSINIKALNLPSLRNTACNGSCTFTRTVKSTLSTSATWNVGFETTSGINVSVSPSTFTIAPGSTQELTITANTGSYLPPASAPNTPGFGYITLTEAAGLSPEEHITVALRGTRPDLIFKDGFEGEEEANPNLVTFELNAPVHNSLNGTCIKFLTGVVRDNLGSCPGDDFNPYVLTGELSFYWAYTGTEANRGGLANGSLYKVSHSGEVIGPSSTFISQAGGAPMAGWRTAGGHDAYLGFRFLNTETNQINYGYVRINNTSAVGTTGYPATIVSYTFDKSGASITIP